MDGLLPQRVRLGLPIFVACDLGLLVLAHVLVGAGTRVSGSAPGGSFSSQASEDNLFSAAKRLWEAQAWVSVAIVVGLSGLWPYVKVLLTMLCASMVDIGRLSRKDAGYYLYILEVLGKYSFADVFLICCNCTIFNISTGGTYRILALFQLELHVWVQLHFAAVALIVAITMSACLTQWTIYEVKARSGGSASNEALVLPGYGSFESAKPVTVAWSLVMAAASICGAGLLMAGTALPIITVDRGGFLGNLIRPREDHILKLSIVSICSAMLSGGLCNAILGVMFFFLLVVAPLFEFAFLAADALALRYHPGWAHWTHTGAECFHSFGCVEVMLLVSFAIAHELHTVVAFNLGDQCTRYSAIMNNRPLLTIAGLGFAASPSCFDPGTEIGSGVVVLAASVACRFVAWRCNARARGDQ